MSLGAENVMTKEALQQIELDRTNDEVYSATTGVARVVIDMIRGVQQSQADRYVELVKVSGCMCISCYYSGTAAPQAWATTKAHQRFPAHVD